MFGCMRYCVENTFENENVCLGALDDQNVLLPAVGQVHVDVERILDHVTNLLDHEKRPADKGHGRNHDPLKAVHEDEGESEAPHGQEARQVPRV